MADYLADPYTATKYLYTIILTSIFLCAIFNIPHLHGKTWPIVWPIIYFVLRRLTHKLPGSSKQPRNKAINVKILFFLKKNGPVGITDGPSYYLPVEAAGVEPA